MLKVVFNDRFKTITKQIEQNYVYNAVGLRHEAIVFIKVLYHIIHS